jgi:hypothetical protein
MSTIDRTKSIDRKISIVNMNAAVGNGKSPAMEQSPIVMSANQDLRKSYGTNWTPANVSVLFEWITIAAYNIRCLDLATDYYRGRIRINTICGLVLSTLAGTVATIQSVLPSDISTTPVLILNIALIAMSFTIAIMAGYIQVYQIQENLLANIKAEHDWISFSTEIASELQLPVELRKDALWIIIKNKNIYIELLKTNLEIPIHISHRAQKDFKSDTKLNLDVSSISRILIDIALQEMKDIDISNKEERISSVAKKQLRHLSTQPTNTITQKDKKIETLKRLDSISETHVQDSDEENSLKSTPQGSVTDTHQVLTINMNDSPTHPPRMEVHPT